jgi:hypothetical protein
VIVRCPLQDRCLFPAGSVAVQHAATAVDSSPRAGV